MAIEMAPLAYIASVCLTNAKRVSLIELIGGRIPIIMDSAPYDAYNNRFDSLVTLSILPEVSRLFNGELLDDGVTSESASVLDSVKSGPLRQAAGTLGLRGLPLPVPPAMGGDQAPVAWAVCRGDGD